MSSPPAATDYAALVRDQADRAARMYLAGRDNGQPDSLEAKLIIESVLSPSYDGRTLIELLQNGHDAQPSGCSDGRLSFLLDLTEGPFGVLYVANGGLPLSEPNFGSLCRVAMSTKRPDESIGNKGVGFKSVLNLSDGVELYSKKSASSSAFDGFCFRFARPEDFDDIARRVAPDEPGLADELRANVSTLKTPVALASVPDAVLRFADWAATVVRLPLRDDSALERARQQLTELSVADVPLHLFLPRLACIELCVVDDDGEAPFELSRHLDPVLKHGPFTAEIAVLQDGTRYAVLRRTVHEEIVLAAIADSVSSGRLPESWQRWQGDAQVSVAVPLDFELEDGRLFTYLPMAQDAVPPLPALVNAPFFPDVDRRHLQAGVPLNDMWFSQFAELCADALVLADDGVLELPLECRLDLASWTDDSLDRLRQALTNRGKDLAALQLLPALPAGHTSLDTGWLWEGPDGPQFGSRAVADQAVASVIDPALSAARSRRLVDLAQACGYSVIPNLKQRAQFAEDLAQVMAQQNRTGEDWAQYYDDLSAHRGIEAYLLSSKIVILDGGALAEANSADTAVTVYFPPGADEERIEGGEIPALVRDRLAFMRADLPFVERTAGRRRRPGRAWLEEHGLVREYRTDALLDLLGQAMRGADPASDNDALIGALNFAFAIWDGATRDISVQATRRARLSVPTRAGWSQAGDAVFGRGWDGPDHDVDSRLSRLVNDAHDASSHLSGLRDRTVLAPEDLSPSAVADPAQWRVFLEALGVTHGLKPLVISRRLAGRYVNNPKAAHGYGPGLPNTQTQPWRDYTAGRVRGRVRYETPEYSTAHGVASLPGQSDWDRLSHRARVDYAHLVVAGLAVWPDTVFEVEFTRPTDGQRAFWPSPLMWFLSTKAWVPQTTPGNRTEITLRSPGDSWWMGEVDTPDFLPAQPPMLRSVARGPAITRLRRCGVRVWDDPSSAADRLAELADQMQDRTVESRSVAALSLRKASEAAWRDLDATGAEPPQTVLVSRHGDLAALELGTEDVYVPEPTGVTKEGLLAQTSVPLLPIKELTLGARLLNRYAAGRGLRATATADITVRLDGMPADAAPVVPLTQASEPWLPVLVLAVLEHKHRGVPPVTPAVLRQAARSLADTVVAIGQTLTTFVDGHPLPAQQGHGSFLVGEGAAARVVVARGSGATPLPEAAVDALSELIGVPQVVDQLRLALYEVRHRAGGHDPTLADIAAAVGATEHDLMQLQHFARGESADWSAVVAAVAVVDADLALALRDVAPTLTSPEQLQDWLATRMAELPWTVEQIVEASQHQDMLGTISALGVELRRANAGLLALGLTPVRNADGHRLQMRAHVAQHRSAIVDQLRDRFAEAARQPAPLAEYLRLIDLPGLDADTSWLDEYWDVPAEALERQVAVWLDAVSPDGVPAGVDLPSVDELRNIGRRVVTTVVQNAHVLAEAWLHRHAAGLGHRPPPISEAIEAIMSAGLMDFGRLTAERVLQWLSDTSHWPEGMELTTSRTAHGFTSEDIDTARERLARAREDARRRTTYVTFNGRTYTEDPDDLRALAEAVRDQAAAEALDVPVEPVALTALEPAAVGPDGRRRRTGGTRASSAPPEKTAAIGLAGEIFVGEWLRQQFGQPPEVTWASGYRNEIFGDGLGSDSHGYDFEVVTRDITYLFEEIGRAHV